MKNLIWKQWHENKRYFVLFMIWMFIAALYAISYELGHQYRAMVGHFSSLSIAYAMFAPIFLAMHTARGEEAEGTLLFSSSLPISLRKMATVRLLGAIATLAIPIIFAALILSVSIASGLIEQAEPCMRIYNQGLYKGLTERDSASLWTTLEQLWSIAAIAVFAGIELLLILSLFGCWLRKQAQIGLMGAVLAMGTMVVAGLGWIMKINPLYQLLYGIILPQSMMIQWGYGTTDGGYCDVEIAQHPWISLLLSIPFLMIIGRLFVICYGSLKGEKGESNPKRFRFSTPAVLSYIPIRWPGRFYSLIWMELRQSIPLVTFGLLFALLSTLASILTENHNQQHSFSTSFLMDLPSSTWATGSLWAVVVGAALFGSELESHLGAFWRSRPISTRMWFWCKFIIGLIVVLSVLDGAVILVSWNAPRESPTTGMSWAYTGCMPIIHAFLFSLAVLGTCWFRKPVIGGFLALTGFFILSSLIQAFPSTLSFEPINVYNALLNAERAGNVDFTQFGYPLVYGSMSVLVFLMALLSVRLIKPLQPNSFLR